MRNVLLLFACSVFTLSCSDDDGASNTPLQDLSQEERDALCSDSIVLYAELVAPSVCSLIGLTLGECSSSKVGACVDAAKDTSSCANSKPIECAATVGEVEACLGDLATLARALIPPITCDTTLEELVEIQEVLRPNLEQLAKANPPSCAELRAKCPQFNPGFGPPPSSPSPDAGSGANDAGAADAGAADAGVADASAADAS